MTRPRRHEPGVGPWRRTAAGRSGTMVMRACGGTSDRRSRSRRRGAPRPSQHRRPSSLTRLFRRWARAERTSRRPAAAPREPRSASTAKSGVSRAAGSRRARRRRARSRSAASGGTGQAGEPRAWSARAGTAAAGARGSLAARWTERDGPWQACSRFSSSYRRCLQLGQLELAEKLDLVLEVDAELLCARRRASAMSASASAVRGTVGVLDEVRVLRRDLSSADAMALEAAAPRASDLRSARARDS